MVKTNGPQSVTQELYWKVFVPVQVYLYPEPFCLAVVIEIPAFGSGRYVSQSFDGKGHVSFFIFTIVSAPWFDIQKLARFYAGFRKRPNLRTFQQISGNNNRTFNVKKVRLK